jgi:co-chaperonin GroES (HSP10)
MVQLLLQNSKEIIVNALSFVPGPDILAIKHKPEAQTSPTGIITETVRTEKYPARGTVIAVGPNMSMDINVGDEVLYNMSIEEGVKDEGVTFDIVLSQNILGFFPKK